MACIKSLVFLTSYNGFTALHTKFTIVCLDLHTRLLDTIEHKVLIIRSHAD